MLTCWFYNKKTYVFEGRWGSLFMPNVKKLMGRLTGVDRRGSYRPGPTWTPWGALGGLVGTTGEPWGCLGGSFVYIPSNVFSNGLFS